MTDINQTDTTTPETPDLQTALAGEEPGVYIEGKKNRVSFGTLFLAALFLAGIGTTYLMYLKAGPKAAVASTAESKAASATIAEFLTEGKKDLANMQTMLADTEKVVQKFLQYPSHTQVPLTDLQTNPFLFEKQSAATGTAKTEDTVSEQQRKREALRATVRGEAAKLKLKSIIVGPTENIAVISGKSVKLADDVEGFTVESIASDSVVVSRDGFRFKLSMSR